MPIDTGWCHCPQCKRWVPEKNMHYDFTGGILTRVCSSCLAGTVEIDDFVLDEHHDDTKCIYCGSYDTVELEPRWFWFNCRHCGKTFRRM